ncbi:MAG: hypothetical protein D3904_02605 [Candidatus Electrothrix sp. EH2]|nr:hypothetical protein [Candidatus Electrothrix sp. EH2]
MINNGYVFGAILKYFEFIVFLVSWVIAILWFKSSIGEGFPYEPAILIVGGLIPLVDSLRRFGFFSTVCLSTRDPKILPWSFSGGKVDKTDLGVELIIVNNKECDLLVRSIEIHAPVFVKNAVGEQQNRIRLVDMDKIGNNVFLPISIPGKSSKTIWVESKHDASNIEKYIQASKIGSLKQVESFELCVTYTIGSSQKIVPVYFSVDTSQLLATVRSKYEESSDHKGVVKLLEKNNNSFQHTIKSYRFCRSLNSNLIFSTRPKILPTPAQLLTSPATYRQLPKTYPGKSLSTIQVSPRDLPG